MVGGTLILAVAMTLLEPLRQTASGALDALVTLLMPVLAVIAGRYLYEGIQIIGNFVDYKLPAAVHAVALVVVQFALIQLAQLVGIPLPEALDGFAPEIATAFATAAIGMGWHALAKKKEVALLAAAAGGGAVGGSTVGEDLGRPKLR